MGGTWGKQAKRGQKTGKEGAKKRGGGVKGGKQGEIEPFTFWQNKDTLLSEVPFHITWPESSCGVRCRRGRRSASMLTPTLVGKGKTSGKPFCPGGEKDWSIGKKLRLHCCQPGHLSFNYDSKKKREPAAPMLAGFASSAKA